MKYQCNSCGKVYDYRSDAVNCHPDINEIPDEQLESRLAAQQSRALDGACAHRELYPSGRCVFCLEVVEQVTPRQ